MESVSLQNLPKHEPSHRPTDGVYHLQVGIVTPGIEFPVIRDRAGEGGEVTFDVKHNSGPDRTCVCHVARFNERQFSACKHGRGIMRTSGNHRGFCRTLGVCESPPPCARQAGKQEDPHERTRCTCKTHSDPFDIPVCHETAIRKETNTESQILGVLNSGSGEGLVTSTRVP
ncbi:hypothetical protein Bbelb_356340 [Branchiostoma belcheri]|nr:hypothetical protein Bbelb_356340 [Branchiostoma belcheri]